MLIDNELGHGQLGAMESVDAIKDFHRDRYVRLSHEMPDDTAEASARMLIRTVPMIYGALLGGVLGNMPIGVSMGFALTVGLDMRMGKNSLFLPLLGPVLSPLCPVIDAIARGLARTLQRFGLPAPSLATMRCRIPSR